MAVVNNIKEIREQRGIYQDELAEATGYCTKTIGRIERGESSRRRWLTAVLSQHRTYRSVYGAFNS